MIEIRPILVNDLNEVLKIEWATAPPYIEQLQPQDFFPYILDEDKFAIVAETTKIVGFALCRITSTTIILDRVRVPSEYGNLGIGKLLFRRIVEIMMRKRKHQILIPVHEKNVEAQMFLRKLKAKAVAIHPNYYNGIHDAYIFKYVSEDKVKDIDFLWQGKLDNKDNFGMIDV